MVADVAVAAGADMGSVKQCLQCTTAAVETHMQRMKWTDAVFATQLLLVAVQHMGTAEKHSLAVHEHCIEPGIVQQSRVGRTEGCIAWHSDARPVQGLIDRQGWGELPLSVALVPCRKQLPDLAMCLCD